MQTRPMATFMERLRARREHGKTHLCVGLDPDWRQLPDFFRWRPDGQLRFCQAMAEATAAFAGAFKPQAAHFLAQGRGNDLRRLIADLRARYPEVPVILDAKRGDIGSTAEKYAEEIFDYYQADAVTLSPYLGGDSLAPFLQREEKAIFVLCRTSNPGSGDFQELELKDGRRLFEVVAERAAREWNAAGNVGLVCGATYPADLARVRALAPTLPFLVPGVGAQGGDAAAVMQAGGEEVLVNASRSILFASRGQDFAEAAGKAARKQRDELNAAKAQVQG